jgi:sugar lactone lactonase YvrE
MMKTAPILSPVLSLLYCFTLGPWAGADEKVPLEEVASFPNQQVTGVAVSKAGRVFVNFPFWSDDHTTSVAEIVNGQPKPYPDEAWQSKEGDPKKRWVCVQSVVVDDTDALWVLDPAAPKTETIVRGGPKLVKFDLTTNRAMQTIAFDDSVAPQRSYLNDVRIDTAANHAYLTDSGTGALIVVDLQSGKSRRVLATHPATKAESGAEIVVDGMKLIDPKTGKAPAIQADGIALDAEAGWLYFHALTAHTMYRVKTEHLRNASLSAQQLAGEVETLGDTSKPDGMIEGRSGIIYLAAFEQNAIARFDVRSGKTDIVARDDRLQWPDTLAWGNEGKLYVTTSQIHRMPKYHGGQSKQTGPYMVYRLTLPPLLAGH